MKYIYTGNLDDTDEQIISNYAKEHQNEFDSYEDAYNYFKECMLLCGGNDNV